MRLVFGYFAKGRSRVPAHEIALSDVERWIDSQEVSPRSKRGYLSSLRILFSWGERRGYVDVNPCRAVELPEGVDTRAIEIHTPSEVGEVLESARLFNLDVCRHLAVRYFTGVRSAEAHRLREEDILLESGFLSVPAAKSKTRARRLVRIQPNLKAWLALGGTLRALSPNTVKFPVRAIGARWPHNVTRHTFVSYHIAQWDNAGKTALEAGHSEAMLFRHYRALATPEKAAEFWTIFPK
jgi:integrase